MALMSEEMALQTGEFLTDALEVLEFENEQFQLSVESEPSDEKKRFGAEDECTGQDLGSRLPHLANDLYFRELGRLPLLSREEEIELAKGILEGKEQIKTLLLRCPVELAWIVETAKQIEKGEIQPRGVMEVFQGGTKLSESELGNCFISCAKEVFELGIQGYCARDNLEAPAQDGYAGMDITARNQRPTESPFDGDTLNARIPKQLALEPRKRVSRVARLGGILCSDSVVARLEDILSTVDSCRREIQEARDKLITANLRFVITIAEKYTHLGVPLADLIQEGNIGLLKAVDRFDYRKGYRFCSYASWWILQGIKRAIHNQGQLVRIPAHVLEDKKSMKEITRDLRDQLGRTPTLLEMAQNAGMPLRKVKRIVYASTKRPLSLDMPMGESGTRLSDLIADKDGVSPLEAASCEDLRKHLENVLASLKPREAKVLRKRFGIGGKKPHTFEEIGHEFGVTRERIRQIQKRAIAKLNHPKRKALLRGFLPAPLKDAGSSLR